MTSRAAVWIGFALMLIGSRATFGMVVSGNVTDGAGRPVAGAHIVFTNEADTSQSFEGITGADGRYTVELSVATAVEETDVSGSPRMFQLFQNYPNPFNSSTAIAYTLGASGHVELSIYNVLGHRIRTLVEGYQEAGSYIRVWEGRDDHGRGLSAGIYFYRLTTGRLEATGKMVMVDGTRGSSAAPLRIRLSSYESGVVVGIPGFVYAASSSFAMSASRSP